MRYKDLSKSDIKYIKSIYAKANEDPNRYKKRDVQEHLAKKYNTTRRTIRNWAKEMNIVYDLSEGSEQLKQALNKRANKRAKKYIITWAQNSTPINEAFFSNIKCYANEIGADIHIIAGRYKNPTSVFTDKRYDNWDDRLTPYLDLNRHNIHKYVSILSDIKVQPTASMPLSGFESVTGVDSCVIGHPRIHLKSLPVLEGYPNKLLMTTGAITIPNYTDSKAGKKGEFHHSFGFVIVEKKNLNTFFIRQVTARKNGDFIDLDYKVTSRKLSSDKYESKLVRVKTCDALVLGDVHVGDHDQEVHQITKKMLKRFNPKNTIVHDVFNGHSISHHDLKDPFILYQRYKEDKNKLGDEIKLMYDWIDEMEKYNLTIIRSNHDDFIDRWLKNYDWKKGIHNSLEYMKFSQILLENKAPDGIIPYLIEKKYKNVSCLGRNDILRINGWELGQHGDVGSSGSRGSLNQFKRLNTKIIVGHYHKPERIDGAMSVGTSTKLRVGYNEGPSAWLHSHILVNEFGKAQHIHIIDGEYTTL